MQASSLTEAPSPPGPRAAPSATHPHALVAGLSWAIPAVLTAGLGLWHLTRPALWADELATWGAVRLSWSQLWQLSGTVDTVFAPYYAAMKVYASVAGTSTAALRLPAVVAIIATTLVVTALGRRIGGPAVGLLAGTFFAVLPVTSRYAQEARPYGFAMLAAALATLFLIRLLERPTIGRHTWYACGLALAGLCQPLSALLVLAGHGVAVLWLHLRTKPGRWRGAWAWSAAAAVGAVPALTLVGYGYRNRAQVSWIQLLDRNALNAVPEQVFLSGAVGGVVLALAALGVRRGQAQLCLAAAAFVPLVALLITGFVLPIWVARYVLVVVPPLAVLAAAAALRFGRAHGAALLVLTVALGYPAQLKVRSAAGHSGDSAKITEVITPRYRPGDVAVFPDRHPSIPWAPRDIYERYLPHPRPPDVLRLAGQRTDGKLLATECPAAGCLGDPPRIWVIRVDNATDPLQDMDQGKRERLRADYRATGRWSYRLLGITLLERRPG